MPLVRIGGHTHLSKDSDIKVENFKVELVFGHVFVDKKFISKRHMGIYVDKK
jgi:hypothetical protein